VLNECLSINNIYLGGFPMNVKPLGDRVVIKMVDYEEKTKGGLFITANAQDKPEIAEVIAVGPGAYNAETGARTPLDVKVGDKVIASKYAGTEVKLGSEEYIVVRADDILAIVE
jgi:chaperonin GroES